MLEASMGLGNFPKAFNSACVDLLAEDGIGIVAGREQSTPVLRITNLSTPRSVHI